MKRVIFSLLLITVVAGATIFATRAYFTYESTLGASTFSSSTLKVDARSNGLTYLDIGALEKLEPGEVTPWFYITVKNNGNINAATFGKFTIPESNGLEDVLSFYDYEVKFYDADGIQKARVDDFIDDGVMIAAFTPNIEDWINGDGALDIPGSSWDMEALRPGEYLTIGFTLKMDPAADSTYMNKYMKLGYYVLSTQVDKDALLGIGTTIGGNFIDAIDAHYTYLLNQVTP